MVKECSEIVDPSNVTSQYYFIKKKLDTLRLAKSPSDEIAAQLRIFEDLFTEKGDIFYIPHDEEGLPYELPICDVRDIVQGLLLMLENDKAVGEHFNLGPPSSYTFEEIVKYLSEKTGMPYTEVRLATELRYRYKYSIEKAKRLIGYNPTWDVFRMIDEGLKGNRAVRGRGA
jgi:nucleoside-diphosphate-sugar epimerase